jgi:hypothetical protein
MDRNHFDELARSMASQTGTRRVALRLLAGGALGTLAARLSFDDDAEAKPKRTSRPAKQTEHLQSEGKRKGKKPGKKKPKPRPQECYSDAACGACERCIGGRCLELIPPCDANDCREAFCNPATNSWECRGTCQSQEAVCCQGVCYAPCSGGRPLDPETCQCGCLPEEWQCADGSCVAADQCCPHEKRCGNGACISADQCCSDPVCRTGQERDPETCACECANEGIFCYTGYTHLDYCCPASHPSCWWAGGTRIGCLTEDQGEHVCPIGWSILPESDPEHRHCVPPPGVTERQTEAASVERRQPAVSGAEDRRGVRTTHGDRARGRRSRHGRAERKKRRGADGLSPHP